MMSRAYTALVSCFFDIFEEVRREGVSQEGPAIILHRLFLDSSGSRGKRRAIIGQLSQGGGHFFVQIHFLPELLVRTQAQRGLVSQ
jgi:hypothetical protein